MRCETVSCRGRLAAIAAALLSLAGPVGAAHAQSPGPVVTDRPDQTESPAVIPRGLVQLEAGWSYSVASGAGLTARAHALPEALVRIGVAPRLELRVGFAGWISVAVEDAVSGAVADREHGIGDMELGFKLRLAEERRLLPEMALLAGVTLPTGAMAFTSDRVDPVFRLALARGLGESASLGVNLGTQWSSLGIGEETVTHVDALYTVTVGVSLTERVGAFVEGFGFLGLDDRLGDRHSLDGGFTFLLADSFQLDASGGVGLSEDADSWFIGGGLSLRLPR